MKTASALLMAVIISLTFISCSKTKVVIPIPVISSADTATGTAGTAFTYSITASNTPKSYSAIGLPNGLTIDSLTGIISGTPTAAGTSNVTINAMNAGGNGTKTIVFIFTQPAITTTQWTIAATTYFGTVTAFSTNALVSQDAVGNAAGVIFNTTPVNGTYIVDDGSSTANNVCYVETINTNSDTYISTGKSGDIVTVVVNAGKITATFSNITVQNTATTTNTTVSGTLIQTQ